MPDRALTLVCVLQCNGQGGMDAPAPTQRRGFIDDRAHEWMAEAQRDAGCPHQSRFLGRIECVRRRPQLRRRAEDDRQLARLLRSGDQQRGAGRLGQSLDSLPERSPQSVGHRQRLGHPHMAGELRVRESGRKLQQRQRVTRRLVEQPAAHRWSRLPRHLVEQHRGHVPLEPTELELLQARCFEAPQLAVTRAEQDHDVLGDEPSRGKGQCVCGRDVQPLRIVHQAQDRLGLCGGRK